MNTLDEVKEYINKFNKRPVKNNNNELRTNQLATWLASQYQNYKNKDCIMKDENIIKIWKEFIENPLYYDLFIDNKTEWKNTLIIIKKYIIDNKKIPYSNKDSNIKKLGSWLSVQKNNYKKNIKGIKDAEIKQLWEEFINNPLFKPYLNFKN
jgi:hypothetical protein